VALYAAYGSNLDPDQMLDVPHSPVESVGWLKGWRLTFGGEEVGWDVCAVTSSRSRCRDYVMLYDVSRSDEKVLDEWEGAGESRGGTTTSCGYASRRLDGDKLAWTYVLVAYEGGLPSCQYSG